MPADWCSALVELGPRGIALVGTTASGKSAVAMEVARATGAVEIVSVDSMAVYREMDLATAKPTRADLDAVPHHLIDVLDPSEECTVSLFAGLAEDAIRGILSRGRLPLYVGGTGLYHRAVIDQLEIPGQFPDLRLRLEEEAEAVGGLERLGTELALSDPRAASRIEAGNRRRLLRALEVIRGTGRPFSSFGPGLDHYGEASVTQVGILRPLAEVEQRIEERVQSWIDEGLLDEVASLARRRPALSRTARQAIGYRELLELIEHGGDLDAALAVTVARTKALARRQRSWFGRDPRIIWFDDPAEASAEMISALSGSKASAEARD